MAAVVAGTPTSGVADPVPEPESGAPSVIHEHDARLAPAREAAARGEHGEARRIAASIGRDAQARGEDQLAASAWWVEGASASDAYDFDAAKHALERAYWTALGAGDDALALEAVVRLAYVHTSGLGDPSAGLHWARHGEAILRRLGQDPAEAPELQTTLGLGLLRSGRPQQALAHLQRAVEGAGTDREREVADTNLGVTLAALARYEEAAAVFGGVVSSRERGLGRSHPSTLEARINEASARLDAGDAAGVEAQIDALRAAGAAEVSPLYAAAVLDLRAGLATRRGHSALELRREALDLTQHALGASHPRTLGVLHSVAEAALAVGECHEAERLAAIGRTRLEEIGRADRGVYAEFERVATEAATCSGPDHG